MVDDTERNIDEYYTDRFSKYMKEKLEVSRTKGRAGWWNPNLISVDELHTMLVSHVTKGDMVDVANIAMMIHFREMYNNENSI